MNPQTDLPATMGEAILTEPWWLQAWVGILVLAIAGALLFVVGRDQGKWRVRPEAIAILVSAILASMIMDWIYASYGYVRLLGLGHLIAWTPVYLWIITHRQRFPVTTVYGKYIRFYLIIAGISLLIDAADVIRYLLGDGELFLRWT